MAKSMKVPVIVFENIDEPSMIVQALRKVYSNPSEDISLAKKDRLINLLAELNKIIIEMENVNNN